MRRIAFAVATVVLLASRAGAQDVSGRALLAFQQYDYSGVSTAGFRQTYDLHLEKVLTTTSLFRLYVRGDDFRGTSQFAATPQASESRQIQPFGEFILNAPTAQVQVRSEWFNIYSRLGAVDSTRRIQRTSGRLVWEPDGFPTLTLLGQRNGTTDASSSIRLTEDNALAQLRYSWRDMIITGGEQYTHSADPAAGYDRRSTMNQGELSYAVSRWGGKFTALADGSAQLSRIDERATGGATASVPTLVPLARALYTVDDTPTDDGDHPLVPYPLLTDGNVNASAGISVGPDGVSFHNLALDLGRLDRVDEIRVIVRDPGGAPLRNGGGAVTWDAYTSQDGQLWTPLSDARTTFNAPLALYSVTFTQTTARWFKVVNFGVNADPTLVTEVQAYVHSTIAAGTSRSGNQNFVNGTLNVTLHPTDRFTFAYSAAYSTIRQDLTGQALQRSTNLENIGTFQYDARTWLSLRGQVLRSTATATGADNGVSGVTAYVDVIPTRQLRTTLEVSRQTQNLDGVPFTVDTQALHTTAFILKSLYVALDVGTQSQTVTSNGDAAKRTFLTLTGNAQLAPSLRVLLTASVQRNRTDSIDPTLQLLGPSRDNRVAGDFIWRPGQPLTISARYGWVSGQELSGFTQRYHVDWYPFAGGTVSLGGSYDQDIDPTSDRRATRMIINPRWLINRFATLDFNYTSVKTAFASSTNQQRSIFATLTLTR
jgi:hypothetical protein